MKVSEPVVVMNEPGNDGHLSPDSNDGPDDDVCSVPDMAEQ
jgi:hypothetical protein